MSTKQAFPVDLFDFNTSSIIESLSEEDFQMLHKNMVSFGFKKGQIIFRDGSYPTGIFYIKKGRVKKYKLDGTGKEQIIYICCPGELIGFQSVLREERHFSSAAAMTDCEIVFIPREDFIELVEQSPSLAQKLLKVLSHEFDVLVNSIFIHAQRPVKDRLILALIVLREKFKECNEADSPVIDIHISRSDLANIIGTSRETAVRLLKELKEKEIINTKGAKISILNIKELMRLVGY